MTNFIAFLGTLIPILIIVINAVLEGQFGSIEYSRRKPYCKSNRYLDNLLFIIIYLTFLISSFFIHYFGINQIYINSKIDDPNAIVSFLFFAEYLLFFVLGFLPFLVIRLRIGKNNKKHLVQLRKNIYLLFFFLSIPQTLLLAHSIIRLFYEANNILKAIQIFYIIVISMLIIILTLYSFSERSRTFITIDFTVTFKDKMKVVCNEIFENKEKLILIKINEKENEVVKEFVERSKDELVSIEAKAIYPK